MLGSCGSVCRGSRGFYLTPETHTLPGRRYLVAWQLAPSTGCRSPLDRDSQLARSVYVVTRANCSKRCGTKSNLNLNSNRLFRCTPNGARKSLSGDYGSRRPMSPYGYRVYLRNERSNNWLPVRRDPSCSIDTSSSGGEHNTHTTGDKDMISQCRLQRRISCQISYQKFAAGRSWYVLE